MTVAQSARPYSNNIKIILKRILALLDEDETDEYGILQPSQSAFKLAMGLLLEAYEAMGDDFPKASASTDEQGSIRVTWSNPLPECEVRLVCPARADEQVYLYHELGDTYAVEKNVTAPILVQWLKWLNQA